MLKIQKIPEKSLWYLDAEYNEYVLEFLTIRIKLYESSYSTTPEIYCGSKTICYVVDNNIFRYNTSFDEHVGYINKYKVYSERFLNEDEFIICSKDELLLLKRNAKINKIKNRICYTQNM